MAYINTGACIDRTRIKTKKALKLAIADDPGRVEFDQTSPVGEQGNGVPHTFTGAQFPDGHTVQVCGPDPYSDRKWYASVKRRPDGSLQVT